MAFETVTVYYDGELQSFPIGDLDLGNHEDPSDAEVQEAVAQQVGAPNLSEMKVDRDVNGLVLNLRPSAQFGLTQNG